MVFQPYVIGESFHINSSSLGGAHGSSPAKPGDAPNSVTDARIHQANLDPRDTAGRHTRTDSRGADPHWKAWDRRAMHEGSSGRGVIVGTWDLALGKRIRDSDVIKIVFIGR
jgi:hypothetical protein